ncbi:unnamed protein product [Aspergillus oryzae RIB40]|uniref:DNA, SC111 n=1 Tax=Aspergillus oryzae (strain ATCC 42149 / RIB 40) TaxID=510516 RepID=Q2U905_ASPOR|nr:unnamed protein product [Aspergillus oryzae RIB40]BAE61960.1 unnamed protein product [Aspergillus oryzae RIB40]
MVTKDLGCRHMIQTYEGLLIRTDTRIQLIEQIINYTFTNPATIHEALRTPGSMAILTPHRLDGHKDLAQLGDAALRLVLAKDGYQAHATRARGPLARSSSSDIPFMLADDYSMDLLMLGYCRVVFCGWL